MAEHECLMKSELERMREDIIEGRNANKEMNRAMSDIRDSHLETKIYMQQITATQNRMAEHNKASQEAMTAGFKAIADKKEKEEELAKADKKEQERISAQDRKDRAKEKRQNNWKIWFFIVTYALGNIFIFLRPWVQRTP
jgi:hypothetical protein